MIRIERTAVHDYVLGLDRLIFPADDPPEIERARWWLAWDGDTPIAFGGARKLAREDVVLLERCGVLPSHRGQRLQLRLIRARCRWAGGLGVESVITYTHPRNPASANSLIHAGFRMYVPALEWAGPDFIYWRRET